MRFFANQSIHYDDNPRTIDGVEIRSLEQLLEQSQAAPEFKEAVRRFRDGERSERIVATAGSPPIKVLRLLMKLLEAVPELPMERVRIEARSGCATYEGIVEVQPQGRKFRFCWDCAWRARESGVINRWGFVDQAAAAQQFGYQCFRYFEEISS